MAHFGMVLERDDLRVCPYNKAHRVRQGRYQNHVIKCRKNSELMGMETCPYDASHIFPKHEKQEHLENCPFRVNVERIFVNFSNPGLASTEVPNYLPIPDGGEESWDNEVDDAATAGYIPKKHAKTLQFVSTATLAGMKPAEKKKFRQDWAKPRSPSPEPEEQPIVQAPALSELRAPRANPMVMQSAINPSSAGIGRGQSPANSARRLAANIFGGGVKQEGGVAPAPLGRGRAAYMMPQVVPKREPL